MWLDRTKAESKMHELQYRENFTTAWNAYIFYALKFCSTLDVCYEGMLSSFSYLWAEWNTKLLYKLASSD